MKCVRYVRYVTPRLQVWSGSLWGGGGIDMGWLDGMTGCGGDCNIDGSSVVFSNFR